MKDFTLSQQYAILGLDGIESLHSSFAKNAVIRGIFVARDLCVSWRSRCYDTGS